MDFLSTKGNSVCLENNKDPLKSKQETKLIPKLDLDNENLDLYNFTKGNGDKTCQKLEFSNIENKSEDLRISDNMKKPNRKIRFIPKLNVNKGSLVSKVLLHFACNSQKSPFKTIFFHKYLFIFPSYQNAIQENIFDRDLESSLENVFF